jgi:hypothetical protein
VLRRLPRLVRRTEVVAKLIREFGRGRSCFSRVLFVDLCEAFSRGFSRRFFRENLLEVRLCDGRTAMEKLRIVILAKVWHGATENGP